MKDSSRQLDKNSSESNKLRVKTFFICLLALCLGTVFGMLLGTSKRPQLQKQHLIVPQISPTPLPIPIPPPEQTPLIAPSKQQAPFSFFSSSHNKTATERSLLLCEILHPTIDPELLGSAILRSQSSPCSTPTSKFSGVWYQMGYAGLGHRICNWMASLAVSLTWGIPPLIGDDDCDRCGPHGCYPGAEDALGLARGITRRFSLPSSIQSPKVVGWQHGASLKSVLEKSPTKKTTKEEYCGFAYTLDQDLWLRDLTLARWGLVAQLLRRTELAIKNPVSHRLPPLTFASNEVAIAVHVRYGGGDAHKQTGETWLRVVLEGLMDIAKPIKALHSDIKLSVHVFTGRSVFTWLREIPGVLIHGSEIDAATTFRNLASSDLLVCGHSSLCFHAALTSTQTLVIVPWNQEPFPYNMAPGELMLASDRSGNFTSEQRIRIRDSLIRSALSRSLSCPRRPLEIPK